MEKPTSAIKYQFAPTLWTRFLSALCALLLLGLPQMSDQVRDILWGGLHKLCKQTHTQRHTHTHTKVRLWPFWRSSTFESLMCTLFLFFKLGSPEGLWPTSGAMLQPDTRIIIQTTDLNQITYWENIIWANNNSAFVPSPDLVCLSALSVIWGLIQAQTVYFRLFVLPRTFIFTPTISSPSLPRLYKNLQNCRQWIVNSLWFGLLDIQLVILKTIKFPLKKSYQINDCRPGGHQKTTICEASACQHAHNDDNNILMFAGQPLLIIT